MNSFPAAVRDAQPDDAAQASKAEVVRHRRGSHGWRIVCGDICVDKVLCAVESDSSKTHEDHQSRIVCGESDQRNGTERHQIEKAEEVPDVE